MRPRISARLVSAALVPALVVSCEKPDTASKDLHKQVAESAAANEILKDENDRTRKQLDALALRVKELEKARPTPEELDRRLKIVERRKSSDPETTAKAENAVKEEALPASDDAASLVKDEKDNKAAKDLPSTIADKVVVIEGDAGRGTGFLCSTEGALWLYTAAHVISGNKTITVRDGQNNRYQTFDTMEVAQGVDLVRLKITNSTATGLELESPDNSAAIGDPIAAIGNSDGTGVVAVENGEIRGKGPDSWEVSTEIIPGNSGGPVVSRKDQKVIGIVTHLLLGKKENWAADTRFAEVRRFAARLDRKYEWTTVTPARFLKEYQTIAQIDDDTKMGYAAIMVYQSRFYREQSPADAKQYNEWISEARNMLRNNPNHSIAVTLNKILDRGTKYSGAENRRELLDVLRSKLTLGDNLIKPEAFTWYHRESYQQSLIWRRSLLDQLKN